MMSPAKAYYSYKWAAHKQLSPPRGSFYSRALHQPNERISIQSGRNRRIHQYPASAAAAAAYLDGFVGRMIG